MNWFFPRNTFFIKFVWSRSLHFFEPSTKQKFFCEKSKLFPLEFQSLYAKILTLVGDICFLKKTFLTRRRQTLQLCRNVFQNAMFSRSKSETSIKLVFLKTVWFFLLEFIRTYGIQFCQNIQKCSAKIRNTVTQSSTTNTK